MSSALDRALRKVVEGPALGDPADPRFHHDATASQGVTGRPEAVVLPASADEVAAVVTWCYQHDMPIIPRGGGSGFSGGCVPVDGGVVIALDRMTKVRAFEPLLWRAQVEAGLRTADLHRIARENGLAFPPDPGAAEQSQIGGNIATNAGGPHAFKYGVTGRWVTGLEAVVAPGDLVVVGGPLRKDVAGYDLKSLLIGSEGTLGLVTAAWLRLIPRPETAIPVGAFFPDARSGCEAIETIFGSGIEAAAIEFLDQGALDAARNSYPSRLPPDAAFMVLAEADGSYTEATRVANELEEALVNGSLVVHRSADASETAALWRWRDGVSIAAEAIHGGKVSEDIAVPLDRLAEAIEMTLEVGSRHDLQACSWGHGGDGNLHSTFLVDPRDPEQLRRAHAAANDLYAAAAAMEGTISGEHGTGWVKRGRLDAQLNAPTLELHRAIKRTLDPKGLMNPGKKT